MTRILLLAAALTGIAGRAAAAEGGFFSLRNTDFIVTLAFIVFVGILIYFKVPTIVGKMLDDRADRIRNDLDEARRLREEAQELYAGYERRQREVKDQANDIVAAARREATAAAEKAKQDLKTSIDRRLKAADDQIASAEADAVRRVRNQAIQIAIAAASEILAAQNTEKDRSAQIDASIEEVAQRLH